MKVLWAPAVNTLKYLLQWILIRMTKPGQPLRSFWQNLTCMALAWLYPFSTQTLELCYVKPSKTELTSFPSNQVFLCLLSSTGYHSNQRDPQSLPALPTWPVSGSSLPWQHLPPHICPTCPLALLWLDFLIGTDSWLLNQPFQSLLPTATESVSSKGGSGDRIWIWNVHLIQSGFMIFRIQSRLISLAL